jgi:hypothetical protein
VPTNVDTHVRAVVLGLALAGLVLSTGGCGGNAGAAPSTESPVEVLQRYVAAVRAGDGEAVLPLLSSRLVDRYQLTAEKTEREFIPAARGDLSAVGRSLAPALERRLRNTLAVAALVDRSTRRLPGPRAYALPLVLEDGDWKVDPFNLRLSYGYPDDLSADPRRPYLTFGVQTAGSPKVRLWLDGRRLPVRRQPGRRRRPAALEFEARPSNRLASGVHVVVAFAEVGDQVGALAWRFRIR